jgi:hypothetical protein
MRGPGDAFGTNQSGIPFFKLADLYNDMELLESAREISNIYEVDKALETHLDLFYYRETSQNKFKKRIEFKEKKDQSIELNKFAEEQLELFLYILEIIDPKVIVVANAFISKIIINKFKDKLNNVQLDSKEGFHRIFVNNKKIPIFFSSMLTQQRALDLHSYERLVWHIKSAIN